MKTYITRPLKNRLCGKCSVRPVAGNARLLDDLVGAQPRRYIFFRGLITLRSRSSMALPGRLAGRSPHRSRRRLGSVSSATLWQNSEIVQKTIKIVIFRLANHPGCRYNSVQAITPTRWKPLWLLRLRQNYAFVFLRRCQYECSRLRGLRYCHPVCRCAYPQQDGLAYFGQRFRGRWESLKGAERAGQTRGTRHFFCFEQRVCLFERVLPPLMNRNESEARSSPRKKLALTPALSPKERENYPPMV